MPQLPDEKPDDSSQPLPTNNSNWDTNLVIFTQLENIANSELPWPNATNYSDCKTVANISYEAWFGDTERENW